MTSSQRSALQYAIALVENRIAVEAPANAAICGRHADALRDLLALVDPLVSEGAPHVSREWDNHHNALTCPYCNPKGFVLVDAPQLAQLREENERLKAAPQGEAPSPSPSSLTDEEVIAEAAWTTTWLAQLAENARVQNEPKSGYNPSGDARPLRTAAERASRLVHDLLARLLSRQKEEIASARQEGIGIGRLSGDVLVEEMRRHSRGQDS